MPERTNLLVSLNEAYIPQLRVLLVSLRLNNPALSCDVYLLHRDIPAAALERLARELDALGYTLLPIAVDGSLFDAAKVTKQYPQEMYYRLLAGRLLPERVHRALYLDPDILVINPIDALLDIDLGGKLFAAASHSGKAELAGGVNRVRLGTEHDYYNSGVLLMDLDACRREIVPEDVFGYVREHAGELLLPDQDVLNALYGGRILPLDDAVWNYDARNYSSYLVKSLGEADVRWVMSHTAILHFCGREKPWKPHYRHRFGALYLHYMSLTDRLLGENLESADGVR